LINFCYIFIIIGVVTFTICLSLQKKYKEEVMKKHGEDFNYEEEPIDLEAARRRCDLEALARLGGGQVAAQFGGGRCGTGDRRELHHARFFCNGEGEGGRREGRGIMDISQLLAGLDQLVVLLLAGG
jgi:hypothetical protein